MERGLTMLLHAMIIGLFSYAFMIFLGQRQAVAENRSLVLSALILIYMIVYGHGFPTTMNKDLS